MDIKLRVTLSKPLTGSEIVEAVKSVAGEEYHQKLSIGDAGERYIIGQNSRFPFRDLVIGVGPEVGQVALDATYSEIHVCSTSFPGVKYMVGYRDDAIIKAVTDFRDKLQMLLQ